MQRIFHVRERTYLLAEHGRGIDGWQPVSRLELASLVAHWERCSIAREELRDALRAIDPFELGEIDGDRLLARARTFLHEGWWTLLREERPELTNEAPPEIEGEPSEAAPPAEEEPVHWIQIEVLDDEGVPYSNVLVSLELPDGSTTTARTNAQGVIYVPSLDDGECELALPELDTTSWSLEQ